MFRNCCSLRMVIVWTVISALLFGGSLLLAFWGIPKIIRTQIHHQTELKEGTEQWDRFRELPFPVNLSIRFFEVQNPGEVVNDKQPPLLKESEPYRYEMTINKIDTRFDDVDEDSVTYRRNMTFKFIQTDKTAENDTITIINPLLMSSLQLTTGLVRIALAGCIDKLLGPYDMDTVVITKPVNELLFDGIKFAMKSPDNGVACEIVRQRMIKMAEGIRVLEHIQPDNDEPDYLKLAIFNYKRSGYIKAPPDGIYTVNRGRNNMTELGQIMRWNGNSTLAVYGNSKSTNLDTCQKLQGTDSTIFAPQQDGRNLIIYNTDICRTVEVHLVSDDVTVKGIKGNRYETSKNVFRPATAVPENDCYCSKAIKDVQGKDNCFLDGLFDFKRCSGVPILISQPHFLHADQKYLDGVRGLQPDETKHQIHVTLEPNTGTPLEGFKRIQLNSILKQQPFVSHTPTTMYEGVIPFLWMEEGISLPDKYIDQLNQQYFKAVAISNGLKYGFIAFFAALFAGCLFVVLRKEYTNRDRPSQLKYT